MVKQTKTQGKFSKSPSLPIVKEVKEVISVLDPKAWDHVGYFTLIAPDPMAGLKHRYSVIRVDYQTGQATCIGRELDLKTARKVAKRTSLQVFVGRRT